MDDMYASVNEPSDRSVAILLKEYELAIGRLERADDRVIQIIGIGFAFFAAVAVFIGQGQIQPTDLPIGLAYLLPLFEVAFYAILIYMLYSYFGHVWVCRVVSQRINRLFDQQLLIRFERNLPTSRFFSFNSGHPKPRAAYRLIMVTGIILFLVTVYYMSRLIHDTHGWIRLELLFIPLGVIPFLLFYTLLFGVAWYASSGMAEDMTSEFRGFMTDSARYLLPPSDYRYPPYILGVVSTTPTEYKTLGVFPTKDKLIELDTPKSGKHKGKLKLNLKYFTLVTYGDGSKADHGSVTSGTLVAVDYVKRAIPLRRPLIRDMLLLSVSGSGAKLSFERLKEHTRILMASGQGWPSGHVVHVFVRFNNDQEVRLAQTRVKLDGTFQVALDFSKITSDLLKEPDTLLLARSQLGTKLIQVALLLEATKVLATTTTNTNQAQGQKP